MGLTRGVHPDLLAAMADPFHPVVLAFVDWPGDPVRVHSGRGTITWGGHDWAGVAGLPSGTITLPEETAGLAMVDGQMTVGGDADRIDALMADAAASVGSAVQVWFGAVTARAGTVLIGEPFSAFSGVTGALDDWDMPDGDIDMARTVIVQLLSGAWNRSVAAAYHSYESQRRIDPDDTAGRWTMGALGNLIVELQK